MRRAQLSAAILGALALGGCGAPSAQPGATSNGDAHLSGDGLEALASSEQSLYFAAAIASVVSSEDPAAAAAQAGATSRLWPPGCATRVRDADDPRVVHVTYADCSGPLGLGKLRGGETITFAKDPQTGHLVVHHASKGLAANGSPITHSGVAEITVDGLERHVRWQGAMTRTNAKGETVSHTTDVELDVDVTTRCRGKTGKGVTRVADREVASTFEQLKVCPNAKGDEGCPSGTVVHTRRPTGVQLTFDLDGSATATVTEGSASAELPLACEP